MTCEQLGLVGEACRQHHQDGGTLFFVLTVVGLLWVWIAYERGKT